MKASIARLCFFGALLALAVAQVNYPLKARCLLNPDSGSAVKGSITFTQQSEKDQVSIEFDISGLNPSHKHGFHIHEKPDYSAGCNSTGGHHNPYGKQHGGQSMDERHLGDLGNIETNANGEVRGKMNDHMITLSGPNSILGLPCMIHAGEDDFGLGGFQDSKTTGHAGPRIACGTVLFVDYANFLAVGLVSIVSLSLLLL
eukprot:TRINITY_DN4495_c0_g1_i3.p1 TRINITY_DN4495_c0_g1~~TRINITY_DN4495_c0_g1_i3.p1  ORF type:complete len:201 (+),score=36.48 TRINITY_DN4495_c0_g1_i3:113-715(+)